MVPHPFQFSAVCMWAVHRDINVLPQQSRVGQRLRRAHHAHSVIGQSRVGRRAHIPSWIPLGNESSGSVAADESREIHPRLEWKLNIPSMAPWCLVYSTRRTLAVSMRGSLAQRSDIRSSKGFTTGLQGHAEKSYTTFFQCLHVSRVSVSSISFLASCSPRLVTPSK